LLGRLTTAAEEFEESRETGNVDVAAGPDAADTNGRVHGADESMAGDGPSMDEVMGREGLDDARGARPLWRRRRGRLR
jgi:hypothetical protein